MGKFQFHSKGISDRIVTPCTLDVSDYETSIEKPKSEEKVKALWDTGSTVTVLSEMLVQRLGLIPSDICRVSGWDGNPITTNTYNIDVVLGETRIEFVNAVRGPLKNIDMIIGMDVISQGDFHITHPSYTTILEFEMK